MSDVVDSIGRNFERLLRWFYPGLLFLLLIYASRVSCPNPVEDFKAYKEILWILVLVGALAGMAIYTVQAYVFNGLVSMIFAACGFLDRDDSSLPGTRGRLARRARTWGQPAWSRWSDSFERMNGWLDYSWGTYHAGCMTVWLIIPFRFLSKAQSILSHIPIWIVGILSAGLLLSLLWQYLILTRITLRMQE